MDLHPSCDVSSRVCGWTFLHSAGGKPQSSGRDNPNWEEGFACYSFVPKSDIPLKVIVLDDTQSETDGSHHIHGHGFLDAPRWKWLQAELAAGQAANQLMIIAAHVPIAGANIGSELKWWEAAKDPNATQTRVIPVNAMDPTRPDGVPTAANLYKDPTIVYGTVPGVPYCASYNAELFKYVNPKSTMFATLQ